ncbi:UxaA family hydrolase [Aeromicrobium sp. CTD01-1L150]|uniref:UxaA family hydrolase n=1 Tax=Aeromicrobium sp. CTD01-1L150 TaxID=3341830 RepID=UPI0035C11AAD
MASQNPHFLAHCVGDAVAVAVCDVEPGDAAVGYLDGTPAESVTVKSSVPLGHKVALLDVSSGDRVTEYTLQIGTASTDIARGDYVHTHNVRSARWQNSVA